jgi:hypothetical protein
LDRGHPGSYSDDEFSALFPPTAPLGAPDDDDEEPSPAEPRRAAASAVLSDADVFKQLYGYDAPSGYFED